MTLRALADDTVLRRHIIEEITHFKGRVRHWDVVNQELNPKPAYASLRDTLALAAR